MTDPSMHSAGSLQSAASPQSASSLHKSGPSENLFSYGTLQLEAVQLATFQRRLQGSPDSLPGFRQEWLEITDPAVVATSGKTHHPIISRTGDASHQVAGTVFQITADELRRSDEYEVADYQRILVTLGSGVDAWVYVDAK